MGFNLDHLSKVVLGRFGKEDYFSPPRGESTYTDYVIFFSLRKICPFFLIYSIINLCQFGLMYFNFVLWVVIQFYVIYFIATIALALATFFFSSTFLLSNTVRCFRFVYFACPSTRLITFLRSSGSLYWKIIFRNQDLGLSLVICTATINKCSMVVITLT